MYVALIRIDMKFEIVLSLSLSLELLPAPIYDAIDSLFFAREHAIPRVRRSLTYVFCYYSRPNEFVTRSIVIRRATCERTHKHIYTHVQTEHPRDTRTFSFYFYFFLLPLHSSSTFKNTFSFYFFHSLISLSFETDFFLLVQLLPALLLFLCRSLLSLSLSPLFCHSHASRTFNINTYAPKTVLCDSKK